MRRNNFDRRQFLKGLGCLSLGSSFFTLALPRGGWAAAAADTSYRRTLLVMGTNVNITLFGETSAKAREAVRDAFNEIRRIDDLMSTHRRYSALSRVNRASGNGMIAVDSRIIEVLRASIDWSRKSEGLFDVTTLPLLRAWGFRDEVGEVPISIDAALECVGYEKIVIEGDRVGLLRAGAEIDLGGIAKGYAVDRAIGVLLQFLS